MKKILEILMTAVIAGTALTSCAKKSEFNELKDRVGKLESSTELSSLSKQVSSMEQSITDLRKIEESIQSEITSLKNSSSAETGKITNLESAQASLQTRISELESTVGSLKGIKDWVQGTFVTLAAYQQTCETLASVKAATDGLGDAIAKAVQEADANTRSWISDQLSSYSTIAQTDAKLSALKTEIEGMLSAQKTELEGKISSMTVELEGRVSANESAIGILQQSIKDLEAKDKDLSALISANATAISNNAAAISNNATQISVNAEAITKLSAGSGDASEVIADLVNGNRTLIGKNAELIAENKTAIGNLSTELGDVADHVAANARAISQNSTKIAEVAELVSSSAAAVADNKTAIGVNAKAIEDLRKDIGTVKTELISAYQSAISDAISTSEGKLTQKIQNEISAVNGRINSEIERVEKSVSDLRKRVSDLEEEVGSIKDRIDAAEHAVDDLIAMVQSVVVIPQYQDGSVKIEIPQGGAAYISAKFEIYPLAAAQELVSMGTSCFSVRAFTTMTKSAGEMYDLQVTSVSYVGGIVTVTADASSLSASVLSGREPASARLLINSGRNSVTSGYFSLYVPVKAGGIEGTDDENL